MKKFLTFYFLTLLSVFFLFSSGVIDSQDGFQYLAVARNIYYTGKPTAPADDYNGKFQNIPMSTYKGKDGNTYSPTGLGFSLSYLPAVAVTDLFYQHFSITPYKYFPLEADWLIFLLASFTNSFFAAGLGIIMFLYLLELGLTKKQSLLISIVGLFATNLLVYAKSSMPHMMFVMFLVLSFYLLKRYARTKNKYLMVWSGLSYGVVAITYNPTFLLPVIPYLLYYFLLVKFKFKKKLLKVYAKDLFYFLIGTLPFTAIYFWFEITRVLDPSLGRATFYSEYAKHVLSHFPIAVIFEGLYGQLFSPGRSIFIYSPLLLLIIFFWHKLKKNITPELIVFLTMSAIYIVFYSLQNTYSDAYEYSGLWHGESSWGPRYLLPLLPFGILLVGDIYKNLTKKMKCFIFLPLVIAGILIQVLGVIVADQDKFHNTERHFFISGQEYTSYTYVNLLPRYSPIITMPKELTKMLINFPKTLNHGKYNAHLYDGIDFPFNVGPERWRVVKGQGNISFDDSNDHISKLTFGLINHPIDEASHSATLKFILNNQVLPSDPVIIKPAERKIVAIPVKSQFVKDKNNELIIDVDYGDEGVTKNSSQILGLISFSINDTVINLESLDFPYISQLGPKMTQTSYKNFGGTNNDPWLSWEIHTQIYERVPDFWWIKWLYYWDLPRYTLFLLFILNLSFVTFFSRFTISSKYLKK